MKDNIISHRRHTAHKLTAFAMVAGCSIAAAAGAGAGGTVCCSLVVSTLSVIVEDRTP
jgi:hypothetical protein